MIQVRREGQDVRGRSRGSGIWASVAAKEPFYHEGGHILGKSGDSDGGKLVRQCMGEGVTYKGKGKLYNVGGRASTEDLESLTPVKSSPGRVSNHSTILLQVLPPPREGKQERLGVPRANAGRIRADHAGEFEPPEEKGTT